MIDDPAWHLAPQLRFDASDPFLPARVAVTRADRPQPSPSFPVELVPFGDVVVEYALWWPCEIGHVYELEHVWVHGRRRDGAWEPVLVEGSAHGGRRRLDGAVHHGRAVVHCEPGKHGTAASPAEFVLPSPVLTSMCGPTAGRGGVCVTELFADVLHPTPSDHRRARRLLSGHAFVPAWRPDTHVEVRDLPWCDFATLAADVPGEVAALLAGVDDGPLRLAVGEVGGGAAVTAAVLAHGPQGWTASGEPLAEVLATMPGELLGFVPPHAAALDELVATLRASWCVTATWLVAGAGQAATLRYLGATVVEDRLGEPPREGDDWVLVEDPSRWPKHRCVGPGGDVDVAEPLRWLAR